MFSLYACLTCGNVVEDDRFPRHDCEVCGLGEWDEIEPGEQRVIYRLPADQFRQVAQAHGMPVPKGRKRNPA